MLVLALGCATLPTETAKKAAPPTFIENDYAKALAEAREKKLPLFVDAWALWCHTCRSMNAFVFTDPELGKLADRYVWLKLDTELAQNAGFVEKFPLDAYPTLFVIDPADERVALRWLGSANVEQLERLLEDGERVIAAKQQGGQGSGAVATLARADSLYGEGKTTEAIQAYRDALEQAPSRWDRRGRVVESLLFALTTARRHEDCAKTAIDFGAKLPRSASYANAVATGLFCALGAPADADWRPEAIRKLEAAVHDVMNGAPTPLTADDVSNLFQARALAREAQGDTTGKRALVEEWIGYLERHAKRARTPKERTVFDAHLVTAALMIDEPERALSAIRRTEEELPDDYNAPARKALLLSAMGKYEDAIAASDTALKKAYGPRKVRVYSDRAQIFADKGDKAKAIEALKTAKTYAESLPASQKPVNLLAKLDERLAALEQ